MLPSVCPECHSGLEFIYEHGVTAAVAVLCPHCAWTPSKEAAKTGVFDNRVRLPPTPMELRLEREEQDAAISDLLAMKQELESDA